MIPQTITTIDGACCRMAGSLPLQRFTCRLHVLC